MFYEWTLNGVQEIDFVMVDTDGTEVTGLGSGFTLQLRKPGGSFTGSAGTKAEIGNGWYRYTNTAGEADTVGPVAIRVTGAGAVQQNLLAVVKSLQINAIEFTYTVTDGSNPIEGVEVWITTDAAGANTIWYGVTDASGIALDTNGEKPFLDPATYYFWCQRTGYSFTNPDLEVVS